MITRFSESTERPLVCYSSIAEDSSHDEGSLRQNLNIKNLICALDVEIYRAHSSAKLSLVLAGIGDRLRPY